MAPLCNRCCCCLKLSTGCVLIGVITLVFYVVVGVLGPRLTNTMKKTFSPKIPGQDDASKGVAAGIDTSKMIDKILGPLLKSIDKMRKTLVLMSCLCLVVSHLLALAAFAGFKWLLLPFMVMQPIFLIVITLETKAALQSVNDMMSKGTAPSLPTEYVYYGAAAFGVVQCYFIIKLLCYFYQLCKRRSPQ